MITYIAPIVALVCGIAVLDERPGAGTLVGLALILLGSWLATRTGATKPPDRDSRRLQLRPVTLGRSRSARTSRASAER